MSDESQEQQSTNSSGNAGLIAKATGVLLGLTTMLGALDAFLNHATVTCKLWRSAPWCTSEIALPALHGPPRIPDTSSRVTQASLLRDVDGFRFQMAGCAHIGPDAVKCSFTVTNSEADRVLAVFDWSGKNFILDSHSITHYAQTAEFGASRGHPAETFVASGVPVDGSITYGGEGRMIEGIARLSLGIVVRETNGGAPESNIKWSNIPLDAATQ